MTARMSSRARRLLEEPREVFAVADFHNCQGEDVQEIDGVAVIALYSTRQTAEQHRDRLGYGYVTPMEVRTSLRSY